MTGSAVVVQVAPSGVVVVKTGGVIVVVAVVHAGRDPIVAGIADARIPFLNSFVRIRLIYIIGVKLCCALIVN